ncbi:hypothetical protein D9M70_614880 [compost metagenome]
MWGRTVLERTVKTTEALFHVLLAEAYLFERFNHDIWQLVTDRTRSDFKAVTDQIILVSLECKRILRFQRFHATLRHRERVVCEVELLIVFVPFVEREVDDPRQFKTLAINEV